jgi:hypothetical protein
MARPQCVTHPLLFYNACVGFPDFTLLVVVGVWELAESVVLRCSRKGGQFSPTTLVLGCKGTGHYSASFARYVGDITNWCFQGCWCTNARWSYGGAHWAGKEFSMTISKTVFGWLFWFIDNLQFHFLFVNY